MTLTPEETQRAIDHGREMAHEREYDAARHKFPDVMPPWSELTEEAKNTIRALNQTYWQDMRALGNEIRRSASKLCNDCEEGIADGPSGLCPGCQAYKEHTT
jgi:hypothetical protein